MCTAYEVYGTGIQISDFTGQTDALDSASIALFPNYIGIDEDTRVAFVGLAQDGNGGVFRVVDSSQDQEVMTWTGFSAGPIRSLVSYGWGPGWKLLAGAYDDNVVYVTDDPVPQVADTTLALLQDAGWQGRLIAQNREMRHLAFTRDNQEMTAYISIAPRLGNRTSIQYHMVK